jgi:hypothetical protein
MEAVRIPSINYDWLTTHPPVEDTSMKHELYRMWKEAVMVCSHKGCMNTIKNEKIWIPHRRQYQIWCRTEIAQRWKQKRTHKMGLAAGNKECKINYGIIRNSYVKFNVLVLTRWLLPRNSAVSICNNTPGINVHWCSWLPKNLKLILWFVEMILCNDVYTSAL